jgi:hypothetical protein
LTLIRNGCPEISWATAVEKRIAGSSLSKERMLPVFTTNTKEEFGEFFGNTVK